VRILLVTPRNPPSFWTFDHILPVLGRRCLLPNLSMPTVAGMTPPEHEIVLCDENVEEIDFDAEADIVGVTGYIVHKARMLEIIAEFRRRGRFVVVGGPYASLCPEELKGLCDVLFVGEAEETWPQFLRDLALGCAQSEYRTGEKPDMSLSPRPRFDLLKIDRYHAMTIQFARGCPFRCEFCDIIVVYGRRPRVKSVAQVMAEVEECHRLGARQIFIVDDNFIGNKQAAKDLLRQLAIWGRERSYPLSFLTEVSLNVAQDEELLELMREACLTTIFVGIESPRAASLAETKKTQNIRGDMIESVHKIQSYGIQVQAGMIVGFDNDDRDIFGDHLRFIQAARIPVSMTGMLQAMPKTPLYDRVSAEGRLIAETTGDQFVFSNIEPFAMSRLELYRGYRALIADLYSPERFGERTRAFLFARGQQANRGRNITLWDIRFLGRFLVHTAWNEPSERMRFTYRLLGEILLRRPQAFKEACSFALSYQSLARYVEELCRDLDRAIAEIEQRANAA
jgi:radical SAM superfamily enzyme YgiQ (UPF0313 family)